MHPTDDSLDKDLRREVKNALRALTGQTWRDTDNGGPADFSCHMLTPSRANDLAVKLGKAGIACQSYNNTVTVPHDESANIIEKSNDLERGRS